MVLTEKSPSIGNLPDTPGQSHPITSPCSFIVHSQASLTQNIPPQIDNAMGNRQKRRRTSPEDHAVLEAAYQTNSKPDKSERTALVKQVALGEKEVQIWFQNRRQNDRRKSKPLLPHEMVYHFRNSIPREVTNDSAPLVKDSFSTLQASFSSSDSSHSVSTNTKSDHDPKLPASRSSSIHDLLNPTSPTDPFSSLGSQLVNQPKSQAREPERSDAAADHARSTVLASKNSRHEFFAPAPGIGKADNAHGSNGSTTCSGQYIDHDQVNRPTQLAPKQKRELGSTLELSTARLPLESSVASKKRAFAEMDKLPVPASQSSAVRLSMAVDGAVKVRRTGEETPSPPKQPSQNVANRPTEVLKRSRSAATANELLKENQKLNPILPRSSLGRSRDARTWEFYCDGDARAALSARAENESTGSAAGAISLIRSQSQNAKSKARRRWNEAMLKPKMGAGNAGNAGNWSAPQATKAKLTRTISSMADLPATSKAGGVEKRQHSDAKFHARSPSGDSDKENWVPGTRISSHAFRRAQPSTNATRKVLQDHLQASQSSDSDLFVQAGDVRHGTSRRLAPGRNLDRDLDRPDYGESKEKGQDLDCIQGLLSLSQGAWR